MSIAASIDCDFLLALFSIANIFFDVPLGHSTATSINKNSERRQRWTTTLDKGASKHFSKALRPCLFLSFDFSSLASRRPINVLLFVAQTSSSTIFSGALQTCWTQKTDFFSSFQNPLFDHSNNSLLRRNYKALMGVFHSNIFITFPGIVSGESFHSFFFGFPLFPAGSSLRHFDKSAKSKKTLALQSFWRVTSKRQTRNMIHLGGVCAAWI